MSKLYKGKNDNWETKATSRSILLQRTKYNFASAKRTRDRRRAPGKSSPLPLSSLHSFNLQ